MVYLKNIDGWLSFCFHLSLPVVRCLFLASSSRFLRSYVTFSAALFFDFAALRLIHHACSFVTIASTPLLHLLLFTAVAAVLRRISICLPFSRSSTLKCVLLSCIVSFSLRSRCSSLGSVVSTRPLLVDFLTLFVPATAPWKY